MEWNNCYSLKVSCPICNDNGGHRRTNTRCSISEDGALATCYYVHTHKAIKSGNSVLGEYSIYRLREVNEDLSRFIEKKDKVKINNSNLGTLAKRDIIYQEMLKGGYLTTEHHNYLKENALENSGYMSLEHGIRYKVPKNLNKLGLDVEGVPGFGRKNDKWYLCGTSGIIMPCICIDENLKFRHSMAQIRSDDPKGLRYSALSSLKYEQGSSIKDAPPEEKIHIAFPSNTVVSYILITEGIKKADIACNILNQPVIGFTGVAAQAGILVTLERLFALIGDNNIPIRIAFDRDMVTNPQVKNAFNSLVYTLKKGGYNRIQQVLWDDRLKGVDDFLLKQSKSGLKGIAI